MPSELLITEDNREVLMNNFQTFVASKKIHEASSINKSTLATRISTLEREIQICEGNRSVCRITTSGFNAQAPKLIYSRERTTCKAVLDMGQENDDNAVGGPIFIKLMTPAIMESFYKGVSPVVSLSCGFEHCVALTASGHVVTWGYGASGSLGHGNFISYAHPKLIQANGFNQKRTIYIQAGGYHTGAVTEDG